MTRPLALAVALVAGCGYHAGSYRLWWTDFPGQRATTSCLDLAITRDDQGYTLGPVIGYTVGNRCEHRVNVDLRDLPVVAHGLDGGETPLRPYDPRHEIAVSPILALGQGQELIEYRDGRGTPAAQLAEVCVDIGAIEPDAPTAQRWMCTGGPP